MSTVSRQRQIIWAIALSLVLGAFIVLTLNVHLVRNNVLLADIEIVELKKKKRLLETEFQARASQHQLALWNRVDLGFGAPRADQYLDGRVQLADLGQPRGKDAPTPIRVAKVEADGGARIANRAMISPISGKPITLASARLPDSAGALFAETVGDLLIEASPIRPAKAQTVSGFAAEASE